VGRNSGGLNQSLDRAGSHCFVATRAGVVGGGAGYRHFFRRQVKILQDCGFFPDLRNLPFTRDLTPQPLLDDLLRAKFPEHPARTGKKGSAFQNRPQSAFQYLHRRTTRRRTSLSVASPNGWSGSSPRRRIPKLWRRTPTCSCPARRLPTPQPGGSHHPAQTLLGVADQPLPLVRRVLVKA
jgi:hypothetical protein